jgi:hypothetical protein
MLTILVEPMKCLLVRCNAPKSLEILGYITAKHHFQIRFYVLHFGFRMRKQSLLAIVIVNCTGVVALHSHQPSHRKTLQYHNMKLQ